MNKLEREAVYAAARNCNVADFKKGVIEHGDWEAMLECWEEGWSPWEYMDAAMYEYFKEQLKASGQISG